MNIITPRDSINKGYRRVQIDHNAYKKFLDALEVFVGNIRETGQSEEQQKNILTKFLHDAFYSTYDISAVNNIDLAIRLDGSSTSNIGVMFEVKGIGRPDMPTLENINTKAFRELLLYYFRQRKNGNADIRHLVITNTREFFIFDAVEFERLFYRNTSLIRKFEDFERGCLASTNTDYFYSEIAAPAISQVSDRLSVTYFSLKDYKRAIRNRETTGMLTHLYRLLSPVHMLKLTFQNDSNSLNERFYHELLYLIGLEETSEGSKTVISRKNMANRDSASLLENTINILESESSRLPVSYGKTYSERLFNVAMELCIVWINRILFLKLLEAQLYNYHRGTMECQILTYEKIHDFDGLNRLFFQVMAVVPDHRNNVVKELFRNVPYLNSSLFEPTELERLYFRISGLEQDGKMKIMSRSVLRNDIRYKNITELPFLEYLFAFLDAYNFSSEGRGEVADKPKTLINASVLGLIFEKINGYKDGSVFTPGFITKYICSSAVRKAVVKKFNEHYGWNLSTFDELLDADYDKSEANKIINTLTICDPAVGSGHFLVSALNEIILIKAQLGCLFDASGRRIKSTSYEIAVENDELIITDDEQELWSYNPNLQESRRIQEAIFKEKRTIIENCLFGVDINPNSVNICRLRLWIELLKNAYYTSESDYTQLETLPNIDINIKCGNSVLQKFGLTDQIVNQDIRRYRNAVKKYKQSKTKEDKADLEQLISNIKNDLVKEIYEWSPTMKKFKQAEKEYYLISAAGLFDESRTVAERRKDAKREKEARKKMEIAKKELEEARANKQYRGGFEWRMEFPEVLDDSGKFKGFDVVLGNPPYISVEGLSSDLKEIYKMNYQSFFKRSDIFAIFVERGLSIASENGVVMMIMPSVIHSNISYKKLRDLFLNDGFLSEVCYTGGKIFRPTATVDTTILQFDKSKPSQIVLKNALDFNNPQVFEVPSNYFEKFNNVISFDDSENSVSIYDKLFADNLYRIGDHFNIFQGIVTGNNNAFIFDKELDATPHYEKELLYPLCHGRDIARYEIRSRERRIAYINNDVDLHRYPKASNWLTQFKEKLSQRREAKKGTIKWYSLQWPRTKSDLDVREKILLQRTRNESLKQRIVATIDDRGIYGMEGILFIIPSDKTCDLYCLLGILNSKLINYLFSTKFLNLAIKAEYLKDVRIPRPHIQLRQLVKTILDKKSLGMDTTFEENLVDKLVYRMYNLTYDEVILVDPQPPFSREEFESINLDTYGQP